MKKAIILLSGGLDSATCLAVAKRDGFDCYTMSFDYGQRHRSELAASRRISEAAKAVKHLEFPLDLAVWGGSALTDSGVAVPKEAAKENEVPVTYVPGRNLVFLSLAAAWGETLGCRDIFIGVNDVDYSNYPDCRAGFIRAFAEAATWGTKAKDAGEKWVIHTPLQDLSKAEIIKLGVSLGVDYGQSVSCYDADADGRACGVCASCRIRKAGFLAAGVPDPTHYR
ncbi:MAG: 7-cyano-7-deazaguanine synthase QueC [Victivallaceae bacterium]|nr:7-cyano-7-deazaguanine synthase QueC [Victivallaceae bacterium]